LSNESERLLAVSGGDKYEAEATKSIGQKMANTLGGCASYFPSGGLPPFTYFAVITQSGSLAESVVNPITTLSGCFRGLMADSGFPPHEFGEFILKIDITITP